MFWTVAIVWLHYVRQDFGDWAYLRLQAGRADIDPALLDVTEISRGTDPVTEHCFQ